MQWAYRYYQLAKFSILLMAVVGTLILAGLLLFDGYWVNLLIFAGAGLLFYTGIMLSYCGVNFLVSDQFS